MTMDQDRKSTRLNSSHLVISYAVFCLKKKRLDLPFQRQLEVAELVGRDDVAPGADTRQRAILRFPSVGDGRLAVVPPHGAGLAVEQQTPACGFLRIGKSVLR